MQLLTLQVALILENSGGHLHILQLHVETSSLLPSITRHSSYRRGRLGGEHITVTIDLYISNINPWLLWYNYYQGVHNPKGRSVKLV